MFNSSSTYRPSLHEYLHLLLVSFLMSSKFIFDIRVTNSF